MTGVFDLFLLSVLATGLTEGWSNDELALYDLVEEVNANFYELFSVEQDAKVSEIKKAYRRLSIKLHPDRNQAPDASEQFQRVASIYEILKSPQLRETYDNVLEFGLPDWRQPIYYIRRARKLSWIEAMLVILGISTVTHYLMLWGAYIDKYLIISSKSGKARRKARKTGASNVEETVEASISAQLADQRPSARDLLPFLICSTLYRTALVSPLVLRLAYEYIYPPPQPQQEDEDEQVPAYMELTPQPVYEYAVADDMKPVLTAEYSAVQTEQASIESQTIHSSRGDKWTCEELEQLVKLTTEKYPAGTPDRWTLVGRVLCRSPEDVAAMTAKLKLVRKDEFAKLLRTAQSSSVVMAAANVTSVNDTNGTALVENDAQSLDNPNDGSDVWSQHDQRSFETALQHFPKGTADRWDKIVNCVPNKTKQQCIDRFKYLSEMVRQRKLQHKTKK